MNKLFIFLITVFATTGFLAPIYNISYVSAESPTPTPTSTASPSPTPTLPPSCPTNTLTTTYCSCNGVGYASGGYCCGSTATSGYWSYSACTTASPGASPPPTTNYCSINSQITSSCICGSTTYSSGYCCGPTSLSGWQQSTACTATTSPTPTYSPSSSCTSSNVWNCYDSASCTTAGGQWYTPPAGGTGNCQQKCSSSNTGSCNDKASCTGIGGNWCGTYCTTATCPTCSSSQAWNCYDSSSCSTAGGVWCKSSNTAGGNCNSAGSTCPTCSSSQLWVCSDQASCTSAGGSWSNNACSILQICTASNLWNCKDQTSCTTAGGQWSNNYCSQPCSSTNIGNCKDQTSCAKFGGQWYASSTGSGYCNPPTTCSPAGLGNCKDQTSCTTAGGQWSSNWCSQKCSSANTANCFDKASCTSASANWCGTYCTTATCPTCTSSNIWNCYDSSSCSTAGGVWCKSSNTAGGNCNSAGSTCPTCTSSNAWNCYTESDCKTAGGNWCIPQYGGSNYCSTASCPSNKCESSNSWNCKTQADCTSAGAKWCQGSGGYNYCSNSCPTCSKDQTWNCYNQNDCSSSGGKWCTPPSGNPYCSQTCPEYKCSSDRLWDCNKDTCSGAGGEWCDNSYSSGSYPTALPYPVGGSAYCTRKGECYKPCPVILSPSCGQGEKSEPQYDSDHKCITSYKCVKTDQAVCDKIAYDAIQKCAQEGKTAGYTMDRGCPILSTVKCTEAKHTCPIFAAASYSNSGSAYAGFQNPADACAKTGGKYTVDKDPFGCDVPRCDSGGQVKVCKTVKDETGVERIECPKGPVQRPVACPQPLESQALIAFTTICVRAKGSVETVNKEGCATPFQYCRTGFEDLTLKNPFSKISCQTEADLASAAKTCRVDKGEQPVYRFVGGCKTVKCEVRETECTHDTETETKTEELCQKNGKVAVKKFDLNGCTYKACAETSSQCDKDAPEATVQECSSKGGEYVINKDENGCIQFADCIQHGVNLDQVTVEPVKAVPDALTILNIVLKLEELKVALDSAAKSAQDIAAYYSQPSDPVKSTEARDKNKAEIFNRVADLLNSAQGEVDKAKSKLSEKVDKITIDELTDLKKDLTGLKQSVLKEVLYLLLSKNAASAQANKFTDCNSDSACFDTAFRTCSKAAYRPSAIQGASMQINIEGLNDDSCALTVKMAYQNKDFDMKCSIENYGLGLQERDEILSQCKGSMVDKLKELESSEAKATPAPVASQTPSPSLLAATTK